MTRRCKKSAPLRAHARDGAIMITEVQEGERLVVLNERKAWAYVRLERNSLTGYMRLSDLRPESSSEISVSQYACAA
ncbi:MAG: hypothetical protein WCT32_05830 [Patescibacteria group bacterium]|jgi:hypothetical protein